MDWASVLVTPQQGRVSCLHNLLVSAYDVLGSGWMLHMQYFSVTNSDLHIQMRFISEVKDIFRILVPLWNLSAQESCSHLAYCVLNLWKTVYWKHQWCQIGTHSHLHDTICWLHVPSQYLFPPIFTYKWFIHNWGSNQCQLFLILSVYKCLGMVLKDLSQFVSSTNYVWSFLRLHIFLSLPTRELTCVFPSSTSWTCAMSVKLHP